MKKLHLLPILFLCFNATILAQPKLIGYCPGGGNQFGAIIHYTAGDSSVSDSYFLQGTIGARPNLTNCIEAGGKLYGMTYNGGPFSAGNIFEYDFNTDTYLNKYVFASNEGAFPIGSLVKAANNKLYGMAGGGNTGDGVIFEYNYITSTYTKKVDLTWTDGSFPHGSLVEAANGKLYGTTMTGGANGFGVIFEYDYITNIYLKKFDFSGLDGKAPKSSLIEAANGKLYGVTLDGGANDVGVIFEYDYNTSTYTKKIDFISTDGDGPVSALLEATNGKLYGLTAAGGQYNDGVLFEYDYVNNIFTKKIDFSGSGFEPNGSLIQVANGKLYGMTRLGNVNNSGTIFEYDINSNTLTKVYDFVENTGFRPRGSLVQCSNGKLYGLTEQGGAGDGVLFEYNFNTSVFTKKVDFAQAEGSNPKGPLIQTNNGNLFGVCYFGGMNGYGVIFKYDYINGSYTKKHDFSGVDGRGPYSKLVEAPNNKLYGMSISGGINNNGVIFEYDHINNIYSKKIDLAQSTGSTPMGGLMLASNGKFYGLTYTGGVNSYGVIFEYDYVSNTYINKHSFTFTDGNYPHGSLMQASNGKLYGMTSRGGASDEGTLFEFDISTGTWNKKIDFVSSNGSYPNGTLTEAANGKLYGMTSSGGQSNYGTIFEYDFTNNIYTKKIDLSYSLGGHPAGKLFLASNNKFYGLTNDGGMNDVGVIFEYDYLSNTYTGKVDLLANLTGSYPGYSEFIEVSCLAPAITASGPVSFCRGGSVILTTSNQINSVFQWFRNGITIPGANNNSYMVSAAGTYSVAVTDSLCLSSLTSNTIRVTIPCIPPFDPQEKLDAGDQNESAVSVSITYNSNNQSAALISKNLKGKNYHISTIDNTGRMLFNESGVIVNSEISKQLDFSSLPNGIYTITLVTDHESVARRVIKL